MKRFWDKGSRGPTCWTWTGSKHWKGYGQFHFKGRAHYAHRIAWELISGQIPTGLHVLHKCDNPSCVRPDHLLLGTNADNMADRDSKGRVRNGQADKTHCKHGHPFDSENTYHYPDGRGRQCRQCWKDRRVRAKVMGLGVRRRLRGVG